MKRLHPTSYFDVWAGTIPISLANKTNFVSSCLYLHPERGNEADDNRNITRSSPAEVGLLPFVSTLRRCELSSPTGVCY